MAVVNKVVYKPVENVSPLSSVLSLRAEHLEEGKVTNVFTFDNQEKPICVDYLRFARLSIFECDEFRLVFVNEFGKSVVLIEADKFYTSELSQFHTSLDYFIDLGCFEISKKCKLVFEISNVKFNKNASKVLDFSLKLGGSLSVKPFYLKTNFIIIDSDSQTKNADNVIIDRKDFDELYVRDNFLDGRLLVDGVKVDIHSWEKTNGALTFLHNLLYTSESVIPDTLKFSLSEATPGRNEKGWVLIILKKRVYNRDTFLSLQKNLEVLRENILYDMRNDFYNTLYKTVLGITPKVEDVDTLLTAYSGVVLNERNRGHYDSYEVPAETKEGPAVQTETTSENQ